MRWYSILYAAILSTGLMRGATGNQNSDLAGSRSTRQSDFLPAVFAPAIRMGDELSVVTNTTCIRALLCVDSLLGRLVGSVPFGLDLEIFFPPTQSLEN